jgi:hypothetical protein
MPRINFADLGRRVPPLPSPDDPRFVPFDRVMDRQRIVQLEAAMRFVDERFIRNPCAPCEQAFRALPGGRSFRDVWTDPNVWISYTSSSLARGFTHPNGRDVAISLEGFGRFPTDWRGVAATLIHEMAHVNGAPGTGRSAEGVLRMCQFADHHDPVIVG